jgi:IS5 family transposase
LRIKQFAAMIALSSYKELVMDGELLRWLYHRLLHDPSLVHTRDCTYGDGLIVLIYFFAALSDRSGRWACDRRNWPIWCRRLDLPSYSQFNKRLKTQGVRAVIPQINGQLRQRLPRTSDKAADGKPLVIGGYSHDPDARWGKVPDGWAKGYKLHVLVDSSGAIDDFQVTALDAGEATVLRRIIARTDLRGTTLRADANYDSNRTYAAAADAGARLTAPRRKPGRGLGHHRHHPDRLKAIAELEHGQQGLRAHRRHRNRVEQSLAHLTNLPVGLWALPNFVRRLARVRLWVAAKITLYHLQHVLAPPKAIAA